MTKFINPHDPDNLVLKAKMEQWLKKLYPVTGVRLISVSENAHCGEEHCADRMTHIVFTHPEAGTVEWKVQKPLVYVRERDLAGLAGE